VRGWIPGLLIAVGAAVFLIWGSLAEPGSQPTLETRASTVLASGIVADVTDGDTIRLADNRRVRLVQIDAPERAEGECYAERSTTAFTKLAPVGTSVGLRLDPGLDARDEHGRVLAYAFAGRRNLNVALVEMGAAAPYFRGGKRGQEADALMAAARRAQGARRGLWGACPGTRLDPNRALDARS
jgi:endonuclease YncB( thermonuclease family)